MVLGPSRGALPPPKKKNIGPNPMSEFLVLTGGTWGPMKDRPLREEILDPPPSLQLNYLLDLRQKRSTCNAWTCNTSLLGKRLTRVGC